MGNGTLNSKSNVKISIDKSFIKLCKKFLFRKNLQIGKYDVLCKSFCFVQIEHLNDITLSV